MEEKKPRSPGSYLKEWMSENRIGIKEFAEKLHVTPRYLASIIKSSSKLSGGMMLKLARYTNTTVEYWHFRQEQFRQSK